MPLRAPYVTAFLCTFLVVTPAAAQSKIIITKKPGLNLFRWEDKETVGGVVAKATSPYYYTLGKKIDTFDQKGIKVSWYKVRENGIIGVLAADPSEQVWPKLIHAPFPQIAARGP